MKLWQVQFHDAHEGMMLSWHSRQREARAILARWKREFQEQGRVAIERVEIPTATRAALAHWLNVNFNRDNG